jgi:hypothetical protein
MIGIEWMTEDVATFAKIIFTKLLTPGLCVMATLAHRSELLERREWIATAPDWSPVIDDGGRLNSADL